MQAPVHGQACTYVSRTHGRPPTWRDLPRDRLLVCVQWLRTTQQVDETKVPEVWNVLMHKVSRSIRQACHSQCSSRTLPSALLPP
jgi:hypothetical protein